MLKNEEEKEDIPKLHPKIIKSNNSGFKSKKTNLKIEISQIHTIEDDDFIIKPNKQESQNDIIQSIPKINSSTTSTVQSNIKASVDDDTKNILPEIMNNNEKDTIIYQSIKELNYIPHPGFPDINPSTFAPQLKKPFWPDNLWKGGTLIYSYKNPEKSLGPPVFKNDKTIRFNSRFESGNLMYAYRLNSDTYHCILEYDHTLTGQCQWFYFQMSNIKVNPNCNRKTTFYISGFNKSNGVFSSGSRVFMYSEKLAKNKKISWYRAGTNYSYSPTLKKPGNSSKKEKKNGKSKSKNKRSTLQFQVTFPYDDDVVYFCYALPYTYTDLKNSINRWQMRTPTLITEKILCKTYGGKDCPLLTITATNSPSDVKKRVIFITARIHPGESNGSIVLHGLIDFLLSSQPITAYLLDHFIFHIVPMINIDGVIEGYYRVGLEGDDLNRVWSDPDEIRHPVVYHTKRFMEKVHREIGIAAYIDFHGHSRQHGTFAYGCPWDPSENLPTSFIDKEKVFPRMLAFLCDAFSYDKCVFSIPPERKDASRCVIRREMGIVNSFTIESSFGGFCSGPRRNTLYSEDSWKEIGARVAEALFHLLASEGSPLSKLIDPNSANSVQQQNVCDSAPKTNTNFKQSSLGTNSLSSSQSNSFPALQSTSHTNSLQVSQSTSLSNSHNTSLNASQSTSLSNSQSNLHTASPSTSLLNSQSASLPTSQSNSIPTSLSSSHPTSQSNSLSTSLSNSRKTSITTSQSTSLPTSLSKSPTSIKNNDNNLCLNSKPSSNQNNDVNASSTNQDSFNIEEEKKENLNSQARILNCLVELAQKEMKKRESNLNEKDTLQTTKKKIKSTKMNPSPDILPNHLKNMKPTNIFTLSSDFDNAKVKRRSKSTVKTLTLNPSPYNISFYKEENIAAHVNHHFSTKNQKQKPKNVKQKKMNEKNFQQKTTGSKNKEKTLNNLQKSNLMAPTSNASKVIKSPRLSKSMKVVKSSRMNRSNSVK